MTNAEGWKLIYSIKPKTKKKSNAPEICFTGSRPSEKDNLFKLAEDAKLKVVKSVTKNLAYLCTGENPGPAKEMKARLQGASIITFQEFKDKFKV